MIIKNITYARLKKMPSDKFENERVELTAELDGKDNPDTVFKEIKKKANEYLNEKVAEVTKKLGRGLPILNSADNFSTGQKEEEF